jgi:hypothetical protein
VTFAVSPDAAARIAFAQQGGGGVDGIYLALVPPGNAPIAEPPPIDSANVIPTSRVPG